MSDLIGARHETHLLHGIASMRSVWGLIAVVCLGLTLAGCDTTDSRYFRYGIGTDLYSDDIVATTQLQEVYLTELCRQALPLVSTSDVQCFNATPNANAWNLIVQAGLNDVDRRCDAYLAWLDDRRRTNEAVLKELGDITVASQAIMRVTGAGANPITLAGLAFGLAANTFTNVNSRLLLEVDKTTVQTLVLRRREAYRLQLQGIVVDNRPAAIHALRSYLTICTPYAIETDINSTVTVFQVGGSGALNRPPLINAETVRATTITRARDPMPERKFPPPPVVGTAFITSVQVALCVRNANGQADPATVAAIRSYLEAIPVIVPDPIDPTSPTLRPVLQRAVSDVRECNTLGFRNAFEVGRYGVAKSGADKSIRRLQAKIAEFLKNRQSQVTVQQTGKFDDQTRKAIGAIRALTGTTGEEIDKALAEKILAGA
ncbi:MULTISPECIES: hypothetical protein [Bradyrhizobium]|uniref:hypothetical protein n=1 Tax=Bradyrhizobium TaxID=374 RepID=UPI00155DEACB|nr:MULTISPECIES: hypothetical protein [Bradyrhizobium]UUO27249.1 hypothetical protein DCG74_08155 [Bradyrhizobium sp. WBAH42]